jgi:hypothetical protein
MTTKKADEYDYIHQRLKEIEAEKEKARNPDQEKPQSPENHEWSFSIDNVYPQL